MWCTCSNCLNKADFAAKTVRERECRGKGRDAKTKATNDFCIVLLSLVSDEDFKALEAHF
eukprot:1578432-Ditylum_brightwellii.AAC.1